MKFQPFEYQVQLRDHLKAQKKTWDYFASVKAKDEQLREFKSMLLKNTYRLDKTDNEELYNNVRIAKEKLGLTVDVTVYQEQNTLYNNASISYLPGEAHIVLSGSIMKLLTNDELLSVIAHELSHIHFFTIEQSEFEITDRVTVSIANDLRSDSAHIETARLFRLYTEMYCDRGSLLVTENINTVLASLIKMNTGLDKISVESYLNQAEEIFAAEKIKSEYETHPENYIRVKALKLWDSEKEKANKQIQQMIEGDIHIDSMDIFKQKKLKDLTITLIQLILKPKWTRTIDLLSLAKQYDKDFKPNDTIFITPEFSSIISTLSPSAKDYLACVLLDFSLADPSLENTPLGLTFQIAEDLSLKESFYERVKKELNLGERKLAELQKNSAKALAQVKESNQEHLYED